MRTKIRALTIGHVIAGTVIITILAGCGSAALVGSLLGTGKLVKDIGDFIDDAFDDDDDSPKPNDFQVLLDGYNVGTRPSTSGELSLDVLPLGWHLLSVVTDNRKKGFNYAMEIKEDQNDLPLGQLTPIDSAAIRGTLQRETTTGGTAPMADCPVYAVRNGAQMLQESGDAPISMPLVNTPVDTVQRVIGFTDDAGEFILGPCEAGEWLVFAAIPGYYADARVATVQQPNDATDQDLLLQQKADTQVATINGTVTSNNRGVADALVYSDLSTAFEIGVTADTADEVAADAGLDLTDGAWFSFTRLATKTAGNAHYSLATIPGSQKMTAYEEDDGVDTQTVSAAAGQVLNRDFNLQDR
ncbi:MAG: hypothetical protein R6V19_11815 [Armatimonadota bacterium]